MGAILGATAMHASASVARASGTDYGVEIWDGLVRKYVDGRAFRYGALRADSGDRANLERFVEAIAQAEPGDASPKAQLAFYINAYNALAVHSVLELWPVESVMKEDGFFNKRTHKVAGRELTLDELEHKVIRKKFDEPRIHFAVNCASKGCPPLADRAYTADRLDRMLQTQTRAYLRRTTQVHSDKNRIAVSKLFKWFPEDFGGQSGIREFVARHLEDAKAKAVRDESNQLTYVPYDWSLNQ
jgi:hypothetical protein